MSELLQVYFHPSQSPEKVRQDLLQSLRSRQIHHKFHYDSVRQAHQWLALHEAYSPARTDAHCATAYDEAFESMKKIPGARVQLIGLGCGGGQKDCRLLQLLTQAGKELFYTASDVSSSMVLVAQAAARRILPEDHCFGLVCDLEAVSDLPAMLEPITVPSASRLLTLFGLIPNFEPETILPLMASALRPGDQLLMSANLVPGDDQDAGMRRILPQYDNPLTRDWLMTFLLDIGIERTDGTIGFEIERHPTGLQRVAARFKFARSRDLELFGESFDFSEGESIRLFFSYRHTPALLRKILEPEGLGIADQWISESQDEGVFLVSAKG